MKIGIVVNGGGGGKVEGQGFKGTMLHVQYNIIMSWR